MGHYDCFTIYDYQDVAGVLTEFDPSAVLREISTDVNNMLNGVISFCNTGTYYNGGEVTNPLANTYNFISNALSGIGVAITEKNVVAYGTGIQRIAMAYVTALATDWRWLGYYPKWGEARYSPSYPGAVDFIVCFDELKYPMFSDPSLSHMTTPKALTVIEMLIGNIGGKL